MDSSSIKHFSICVASTSMGPSPPVHHAFEAASCYLHVSFYISPFSEPPWLKVQLMRAAAEGEGKGEGIGGKASRCIAELSVHPPVFTEKLSVSSRQFYMRMDSDSSKYLADQLIKQGAISLIRPKLSLPLNASRGRAMAVELLLDEDQMVVERMEAEERMRLAEDESRFLSNTYIMHLGM